MSEIWQAKEFLDYHNAQKQGTFLSKFIETGHFSYFIETKTVMGSHTYYYEFFDQYISKQSNYSDV